jgi:DNA-directed RNA polymerase specialized sigma24 family protein
MPRERMKPSRFPETRWSLVGRAAASDAATRQEALAELLAAYSPALRTFLIEVRRLSPDLADDLVQEFIADKILARNILHHADRGRGKFRNFVLKALNNFTSTKLRREYAPRAVAAGLDVFALAAPADPSARDRFEQEWVQQVVRDALQLMEADCSRRGRGDLWDIFCLRVVHPMLHDAEPADYETIVRRLGIETPRQAMNLLATAKRCFEKHLRFAVGRYAGRKDQIDEEIADLREIAGR